MSIRWKNKIKILLFLLLVCIPILSVAESSKANNIAADIYHFNNQQEQQRFQKLINELRCLVCQNQNLADSNAPLAGDLRQQIAKMIAIGATDENIIDYMVERYGDFILYKPPLTKTTSVLWFGPFILLVLGLLILLITIHKMKSTKINQVESKQVDELLKQVDIVDK